ncbi:MAG TPA: nucleotide sugar dehydrogenase [Chthonomonadaceae bacterium]|nr:nucleotide sugar dehydrogenase [Chthonomonadaceae bacterium]
MTLSSASKSASRTVAADLQAALKARTARLAVVGMGYVGLPMAIEFARAGFPVVGIDVDPDRCEALAQGRSYIADVSDEDLQAALATGRFQTSADTGALAEADAILICVPTPLRKSKDPDLSYVLNAGEAVARHLKRGQLIVLESTTYPGTTEEVLLPMLEAKGLCVGKDFFLAFSPERVDPGNPQFGVQNITKLVGGVTPACTALAVDLYRQFIEKVIPVSNTRVAEAAKLLENTFRSVNIALVNEMALVCRHLGVDVWEVIDAAATKPFGFMPHYPGPGIGGHCIPLDPHYLSWKARLSGYEPRLIGLASEINGGMPHHVADLITQGLNDQSKCVRGSRILLLGVAYKPNVGDVRESPALEILRLLDGMGARLSYCDPYVPTLATESLLLNSLPLTPELLRGSDCAVVVTHHRAFDYEMIVRESPLVVDTRNATRRFAHLGAVCFL